MWCQEENRFLSAVKQNPDGWERLTAGELQRWEQNCCEGDTLGREEEKQAQRAEGKILFFFFVIGILLSLGFLLVSNQSGGATAVDKSKRKIN